MINKQTTNGAYIMMPYFRLLIAQNGEYCELPEPMREMIDEYDLETEESGATTLEFTVHDPDFVLLNSSIITEDTPVYFECGWLNDWDNIVKFEGYISTIDFQFTSEGYPTLTITCMDKDAHKMNREEKTRTFENKKRSDIAKQIFAEYGLECVVEDSGERSDDVEEKITQSNMTDIAFLQDLAGDVIGNQFICYVENGVGYFKSRDFSGEPVVDLWYRSPEGNDISRFICSINKETIKKYKSTSEVSATTGKAVKSTADSASNNTKKKSDTSTPANNEQTSNKTAGGTMILNSEGKGVKS